MRRFPVVRVLACLGVLAGLSLGGAAGAARGDAGVASPADAASPQQFAATDDGAARTAVAAVAVVGGRQLRAHGVGQCRHEPHGFVYGAPASLWTVEFSDRRGPLRRLDLAVWQLDGQRDRQMSLDLEAGDRSYRIATVTGGAIAGSGTVAFEPGRDGGRFEIRGKDAGGDTIELSVACARFGAVVAEGG